MQTNAQHILHITLRIFIQDTGDDYSDGERVATVSRKTPAEDFNTETPLAEGEREDYSKMEHSDFSKSAHHRSTTFRFLTQMLTFSISLSTDAVSLNPTQ